MHDTVNNAPVADPDQRLTIDADNKLQPVGADPAERLAVGRYLITVEMTHPNFLGTANLLITADIQEELLPANVVADRDVSQLVVVGHSGEGYEIPVVTAAYTLANAAYDENEFTLALDYELQILNPMPNSDLAATMAADVLCVDETSRSCAPLRISLTITYAPVSHPMLERTERVTVAGDGDEDPYNDPNIAALNTGNFANATFAKVPPPESSVSLLISEGGTISTDGDLFVGAYTLLADATSPDFLGTARASLGLTVRGILNPAANDNHYGIQGPDINPLLVAPGYGGDLQELAARVYLRGEAFSRARIILPSESPAGVTVRRGANDTIAVPHPTIALAPEETLVAVLTLTVERVGVDNPELYDKLPQLKTITISALAIPETALATVTARLVVDTFETGGSIISLRTAAYANGLYSSANFAEHAESSPDLSVVQNGVVSAQRDLALGAYEFTVLAEGSPPSLSNPNSEAARRFFHGTVTIAVSVLVERGAETIAPDDVIAAASREVDIDAALGYSGDGYTVPVNAGYELTGESWETAAFNYDAANEVIEITTPIAGDVSYVVTARAGCTTASGRLCTPIEVTITANFNSVSAPAQAGVATMYLDPFIALLDLPDGYKSTDANTKFAGVLLSVSGVNGWTGDIADLSLQAANGQLGYSPNGVAEDALTAGQYTITVEMGHLELLGTVTMEVAANITPRALDLADYGFSEAPVIAVAPGASAVNQPIAVLTLTGGATDAQAALPDEADFPSKLSLALSEDNRGFTVYVSTAFTSEEIVIDSAPLTVTRPGGNYAPLSVPVPLTVGALRQPAMIERSAMGVPYPPSDLADLKADVFADATFANAEFNKVSGAAELLVDETTGVVSNTELTSAGTYDIVVDANSPDFVGTVRLTLQLILTDRPVLLPANTIPTDDRAQEIAVVAGYAGSVAYFVATDEGVTLQTPDPAPTGFNFGANGAGADFVSPLGFTLFVNELASGQVAADFQVSAILAGHDGEDITLNITVAAVDIPAQTALNALNTAADYGHALAGPPAYPFTGGQLQIIGVHNTATDAPLADFSQRLDIVNNAIQPANAPSETERLAPGQYDITVQFTHPGFLGAMNLVVAADIEEELFPDNVVVTRVASQPVAVGHSGSGYRFQVEAGYNLVNFSFDGAEFQLFDTEPRILNPMPNADLVATLAADVSCADATRNCAPLRISLTVTYTPVDSAPAQTDANAQYLVAFDHPLAFPFGYQTGGVNENGRVLNITGVNGLADSSKLSLNIDGDNLKYAPNGVAEDALTVGGYTVTVEMIQPNLLGTVTMEVPANITRAQLARSEYGIPSPVPDYSNPIPVARGEGGNGALIAIASLTAGVGATISGFTQRAFDGSLTPDNRGIEIRTRTNANYGAGGNDGESAIFTVTVTRNNPNYADLVVELTIDVFAFAPPPLLQLSAQGTPTYTSANITNLLTDAFSHPRYNGATFTQVGAADTDLNFASDTGIVSGDGLAAGTHTLTVDATFPVAVNTRPNFVGFSRAELILTVELASPNPDNVVANRQISQPIAVGHSGDPGYVIPIAANYTLANPDYDETQITIANGNEIRLAAPMPNADLVAAITADVECINASIGACGALKMTLTATFTPVSTGTFLNVILPNRTDPFGTYTVPRPDGYPNAALVITRTSHLGILRHDGTQIETLAPPSYFALNADDDLVQGPAGFPVAGNHGIGFGATDPGYLGTVAVVGVVQSPANALGPDFALAETSAVVTVVPGYSGRAYETTLQTPAAVIGSPYVVSPDSGFLASTLGISGNTALAVDILGADTVTPGGDDILATIRATIGNGADPDNYQPVGAQLELRVVALPAAPLLELSAPGTPTYSSNSIADFTTGDYAAYANAVFQKDDSESSAELQLVDGDSGVVSGSNLAAGTYTLAMDATSPDFVGTARLSLRLTVELASPNPDDVIADREVTQPVAILHSGAPGYVIPVAANYTLANPSYDEAQITLADNHEVRLVNPMPAGFDNVVAALTADVECVDPSVGLCGPLQISVTITFTPVNPGFSFDFLVVNPADTDLTFPVALPSGYARDDAVVNIVSIGFTGILRHDGVQIEEPRNNAFDISGTDIVGRTNGFPPDAGTYLINMEVTHPGFLGRLSAVEVGTVNPDALGPQYALAETAATVTVVPGFAGRVYSITLQTSDGVIGSPYVVPPAASGVVAGLFGDDTLGVVIEDIVGPGAEDILATIRATIGNRADPANFQPVGAQLELRIAALPETPATVYTFVEETYNNAALHDFRTVSPFENATFTEVPDDGGSAELNVTPEGVVGTDGEITSTGTYAITVEATDASAFVGAARLTLSLRLVGTDSQATADELLADGTFAPALNVAEGESGEIYRLEVINDYSLDYEPQEANPQLVLDSGTGAISIPTGETMGTAERRVVITATVLCPASGKNPRDITCLTDDLAQTVSIIIAANGVANPAANFAVFYDEPDFAETIPLPAGYTAADINIVLPPQAGLGLTPDSATLTLDETNYPAARVHPVPVEYAHPAPDLSGGGFWGTLTAAINLTVQQANPPTIPASEIGTGSNPDLRSTVVIGPGVVEATLRAWSGTEGGSPGAAAEFRGPPLAKTEFFIARYFSELSADRKTLFLSLNPENDAVRNTAASGGDIDFTNLAEVTLVGPGDDSANYAAVVQDVHMQLVFRAAPSASPALQMNAPLAANSQIFNFRADSTGGYDYATDFANATFAKISGSDELTITPEGVVQNPNQIDIGGNYNIVAQATSDDWVGTARVTLELEVLTAQDVLFGGEVLSAPAVGVTQTIVLTDIEADIADIPVDADPTLYLADMVYHGVWRGLHWVYGEKYLFVDTSGEGSGVATRAADSNKSVDNLNAKTQWFDFNICAAGGEGWRVPRLAEMVGGLKSGSGGGTEVMAVPDSTPGPFRIRGYPIAQQSVRAPYPPTTSRDTATGPLQILTGDHYHSLPVSSADSAAADLATQQVMAGVLPDSGSDAVVLRALANKTTGRAVCVLEAGSKTIYEQEQNPREWAIALTESNVPATVAMDNIGEDSAVAVGATVYLGVFPERGLATPLTLTADMREDNEGKSADLGMARHDLFTDYFRFGLFPVSGGGAALSVWALPKAADLSDDISNGRIPGITEPSTINDYVNGITPLILEIGFQPQGGYFGHAQLPFLANGNSQTGEPQFNALRLTITFTPPPPPPPPPSPVRFEFGGVSVSVVGQAVDVSALDNIFSLSPDDLIEVRMEYAGLRGGLEVMRSIGDTPARGASFADRLCTDEGGAGWRNPKITEFAMLLTAPSISEVTVSVDVGDLAGFSSSGDLALTFPELSSSEAAVTDSAIVPLANLNVQTYLFTVSDDGSAAMSAQNNFGSPASATFLCVRETDAYDPSLHNDLVGVRFHDETFDNDPANFSATGELNESGARTAPQSTTRSAFTITAIAWHYNEADVNLFFPKHVDKGGEPISVRLNDSADSSTYELLATPVSNQPGVLEVVILLNAESTAADDVVLLFETELGDSRLLTVTIPSGSGGTANSAAAVNFTAGSNGALSAASGGSDLTSGGNVTVDRIVIFTATPSSGYYVSAWTGDAAGAGCATGISETASVDCRIRVPSGGLNVGVSFAEVPPLAVYSSGASASGGGGLLARNADGDILLSGATIAENNIISFTATPADGFHLLYWEGAGTGSCASGSSQTDAVSCDVTAGSSGVEVGVFFNDVHESELTALCTATATGNTDSARIRTVKGYAAGTTNLSGGPDIGAVCIFGDSTSPLSDIRTCFAPGDDYRASTHAIIHDSTGTVQDLSSAPFCSASTF